MSDNEEQRETPPDMNTDDHNTKNDDLMFVSAVSPVTTNISLDGDDDEDENPFGLATSREKSSTNTTNTVEVSLENEPQTTQKEESIVETAEEDIFQAKPRNENQKPLTVPLPSSTPVKEERNLFYTDSSPKEIYSIEKPPSYVKEPSTPSYTKKNVTNDQITVIESNVKLVDPDEIQITVSDPTKAGEGLTSYLTYRITTKTKLSIFKAAEFSVNRRFSDFLGLHNKLINKYLQKGLILPSPPEKDTLSMAKVKISKDETVPTDFIDRRRGFLERYLNRLVRNAKLINDSDIKEFIENPLELPKSTNTQALSGAGVLRAITSISNQVSKLATRKTEQDQWFEDKNAFVVQLQDDFKYLYNQLNTLFSVRREAEHFLRSFAKSLHHLATAEEHPSLSSALTGLANLEERLEQIAHDGTSKEYSTLTELIKEYVSFLDMVQLSFQERIKMHQHWLNCEDTLKRKQETKMKLEQTPKGADRLPQIEMEIQEWQASVSKSKSDFENISTAIKEEIEIFEQTRVNDLRNSINTYLKNLLDEQEKNLEIWETYLPEANRITA